MSGGKGVILYKKIKTQEDLDVVPKGEFFSKIEFYSTLMDEIIGEVDCENMRKFWRTMRLKKLPELNDIYNFQDTIILCKIFENRAKDMTRRFSYNPRKCTSASSLSGCIHLFFSKAIIALPTQTEIVELFEKALIGRFSCVNTRLAFDLSILLPKNQQKTAEGEIKTHLEDKERAKKHFRG